MVSLVSLMSGTIQSTACDDGAPNRGGSGQRENRGQCPGLITSPVKMAWGPVGNLGLRFSLCLGAMFIVL